MILLGISFVAGVLTVLAPCTISLLPVIVGGSVGEGQSIRRAMVVTGSLGISVIIFTFILKVSTTFINIPQEFWQTISGGIIFIIGFSMIVPKIYESLPWINKLNQGSNKLLSTGYNKKNFWGDVIVGAALGPVFSSCSPTYFIILATILPRSLTAGFVYLFAYALGLSIALLVVTFAGQKLLQKLGLASDPSGWIKRTIGIIFIIIGIAIIFGYDKKLEIGITNAGYFDITKVEQGLLSKQNVLPQNNTPEPQKIYPQDSASSTRSNSTQLNSLSKAERIAKKSALYPKAPEITDPSGFINTDDKPIKISDYIGKKVILVDFWTYSCINCQRTLPYMKAWYDKYSSQGLEIISIHTPEFGFEKVQSNVKQAVQSFGIKYPVVMDNDYGTWNAFGNEYWPRKYLIDIDGYIVYDHAGEGNYDETEKAIQNVLNERASVLGDSTQVSNGIVNPKDTITVDNSQLSSPETYFGSNRNEYLANGVVGQLGLQNLTVPQTQILNSLYLGGSWNFQPEYAESAGSDNSIFYKYKSKNVYFVASSNNPMGTKIQVLVDGKPVGTMAGADVAKDGTALIKENRLYNIISGNDYEQHTLEIRVLDSGLDAYTFTFG